MALRMRWYGGGVYELATPDDSAIVLVDGWVWSNTGFGAFGLHKPTELRDPVSYAAHIKMRKPKAMLVALTHDHADHIGDYFVLLHALNVEGVPVKTAGQSDLFRVSLARKFKDAELNPWQIAVNKGNGLNFGGAAAHGDIHVRLVPAVHSTDAGYPSAGFMLDIAGTRVYASGDTDLFSEMKYLGERYRPHIAVLCAGNGAFTMGPEDAAQACKLLNVPHAVPVHYAHNPLVLGTDCGERFRHAVAEISPETAVTVLRPGESALIG